MIASNSSFLIIHVFIWKLNEGTLNFVPGSNLPKRVIISKGLILGMNFVGLVWLRIPPLFPPSKLPYFSWFTVELGPISSIFWTCFYLWSMGYFRPLFWLFFWSDTFESNPLKKSVNGASICRIPCLLSAYGKISAGKSWDFSARNRLLDTLTHEGLYHKGTQMSLRQCLAQTKEYPPLDVFFLRCDIPAKF